MSTWSSGPASLLKVLGNGVFYNKDGWVVFSHGRLAKVVNTITGEQVHFKDHTEKILALSLHRERNIVATSQLGRTRHVSVWDTSTGQKLAELHPQNGVSKILFNSTGDLLTTLGCDPDHTVEVFRWKSNTAVGRQPLGSRPIFAAHYSPHLDCFVFGGRNAMSWISVPRASGRSPAAAGQWALQVIAGDMQQRAGAGRERVSTVCSICTLPNGSTLAGTHEGDVLVWGSREAEAGAPIKCERRVVGVHAGPVYVLRYLEDPASRSNFVVSASDDGRIVMHDAFMSKKVQEVAWAALADTAGALLQAATSAHDPDARVAAALGDEPHPSTANWHAVRAIDLEFSHGTCTKMLVGCGYAAVVELDLTKHSTTTAASASIPTWQLLAAARPEPTTGGERPPAVGLPPEAGDGDLQEEEYSPPGSPSASAPPPESSDGEEEGRSDDGSEYSPSGSAAPSGPPPAPSPQSLQAASASRSAPPDRTSTSAGSSERKEAWGSHRQKADVEWAEHEDEGEAGYNWVVHETAELLHMTVHEAHTLYMYIIALFVIAIIATVVLIALQQVDFV